MIWVVSVLILLCMATPAHAEPVSTTIGLTSLIASSFGVTAATAGAIGGFALSVGASFALKAASLALAGSQKQSQLTGGQGVATFDEGVRQPVTTPIPDMRLALGTVTTSGALFFRRSDPPFIWRGFLLAAHECGDLVDLILNGQAVPLGPDGSAIAAPFFDGSTVFLEASFRRGTGDQTMDRIIARDFPGMPDTFRQRGHATLVLKAHYGANDNEHKDIYGSDNVFNPLIRFQGAKLIDPRVPGVLIDDPSTWVHSNSASLTVMRALYHQWPNMRLLDPGSINWDLMAEAADIDDQFRGKSDGTLERNHTCDGVILSSFEPLQKLKELLTSCDGLLVAKNGKYHILPGHPREPIGTLHQDMLAGGFELHTETPDRELINIVKTEFVAPDRDYKPSVGPVLRRDDLIATDGEPLESTLSLPFTEGSARAQRLASRKLKDSRGGGGSVLKRAFSGSFNLEARRYRAGDIVRLAFRDFPKVDGVYQIRRTQRDRTGKVIAMDMVSWSNAQFDWYAPDDEQPFALDEEVLAA